MRRRFLSKTPFVFGLLSFLVAWPSQADTFSLTPSQDTTLYEGWDNFSNGAGDFLFTAVTNNGEKRHALLRFTLNAIPRGAEIENVSLTLRMSRSGGQGATISLHRLLSSWDEGDVNADSNEGSGDPATPGDATWIHRSFNDVFWTTPGGDFEPTASASLAVAGLGTYTWVSTAALVADVQRWLDAPLTNFGWLLKVDNESGRRAKRWNSRTNSTSPPLLTVIYTRPLFYDGFESGDLSAWSPPIP